VKAMATPPFLQRKGRVLLWVLNTGDEVGLRCPRPRRGLSVSVISSLRCLKHQGDLSLDSWCLAPTPKERPACYNSVVSSSGCLETPSVGKARSPPGGHSLHGLSFPWVSGSDLTGGSLVSRRSFLPMGIGEATPLVINFDFFDFVSLHSLSYLWVSGRRRRCMLGVTFSVLATPGAVKPLTSP